MLHHVSSSERPTQHFAGMGDWVVVACGLLVMFAVATAIWTAFPLT
jgi:hypothetical protein